MLKIGKADYDLIRWEAKRSYPYECCGILLGNVVGGHRQVTLTLTCENMRVDSPADRYSINPEQVIAALKAGTQPRRKHYRVLSFASRSFTQLLFHRPGGSPLV